MSSKESGLIAGGRQESFETVVAELKKNRTVERIWKKDASVWSSAPEHQKIISNSLGWLTVAELMLGRVAELKSFAEEVRAAGFAHAVVLGMGGSSLAPEVLSQSFGPQQGYPKLHVLDSTVPGAVLAVERKIDLERTLFIVASKSGSTTEPQMFQRYFFDLVQKKKGAKAGENFVAITDPGSMLEGQAKEGGYRKTFVNMADIGGRYSALSYFGMVPFAVMGGDVETFLSRANVLAQRCKSEDAAENPGLALGALLGSLAREGVDKVTFATPEPLTSLGLWIEQLIAESTGKVGKGIVPIAGEALADPAEYGKDRLFALIEARTSSDVEAKLNALEQAGFPVIRQQLKDLLDLGATFFLWEFATAIAGAVLGIDAFDQPNVQESKDNTKRLIGEYTSKGSFPQQQPIAESGHLHIYSENKSLGNGFEAVISAHLKSVKSGDYVAITQYFVETPEAESLVQQIRLAIRNKTKAATTTGYGPRFLHSTGQLHKGGPNTGVFIQLTAQDQEDTPIPDEKFGFSVLKQAQSLGDFESLVKHGRRAIRVDLGADVVTGLKELLAAVQRS